MRKYWNQEDHYRYTICCLLIAMGLVFGMFCLTWYGWVKAPNDIILRYPPDLSSGASMKATDTPPPYVVNFAYYIWQQLYSWQDNGAVDYKQQLKALKPYLTPPFFAQLERDYQQLLDKGQLQNRIRFIHTKEGLAFQSENIQQLDHRSWVVYLDVTLREWVGGTEVKQIEVTYPINVVRDDTDRERNAFGLKLAGFAAEPYRISQAIKETAS